MSALEYPQQGFFVFARMQEHSWPRAVQHSMVLAAWLPFNDGIWQSMANVLSQRATRTAM